MCNVNPYELEFRLNNLNAELEILTSIEAQVKSLSDALKALSGKFSGEKPNMRHVNVIHVTGIIVVVLDCSVSFMSLNRSIFLKISTIYAICEGSGRAVYVRVKHEYVYLMSTTHFLVKLLTNYMYAVFQTFLVHDCDQTYF